MSDPPPPSSVCVPIARGTTGSGVSRPGLVQRELGNHATLRMFFTLQCYSALASRDAVWVRRCYCSTGAQRVVAGVSVQPSSWHSGAFRLCPDGPLSSPASRQTHPLPLGSGSSPHSDPCSSPSAETALKGHRGAPVLLSLWSQRPLTSPGWSSASFGPQLRPRPLQLLHPPPHHRPAVLPRQLSFLLQGRESLSSGHQTCHSSHRVWPKSLSAPCS